MPRLHAARILMVMTLSLATLLLGFPAGRGIGAVGHAAQPTLGEVQQQLDACRSQAAEITANLHTTTSQYKKAKAGTLILAVLPGAFTAIPVEVKAWQALISLDLIEGKLSPADHDKLQAEITRWQASTVDTLKATITSGVALEQETQQKCAALERQRNQLLATAKPGQSTILKLVPALTKVVNTHAAEMTIDPAAGSASEKHCCDGGSWDVTYSFEVPETIVPGTNAPVTVGIQVNKVNPEQPLGFQITVLAPDFAQAYSFEYPHPTGGSKAFAIPVSADYSSARQYTITIGFNSSSVTYTYQP